ncbi:MAG: hypothetical protein LC734_01365, partial [Acidobacteria bacterium]|nr:hypothetical protein [Acidobacteriota bacterium]
IMSYTDPCTQGCPKRPYFSNPGVLSGGVSTGIEGSRDNARSLNGTADSVANYRYSGQSITLSTFHATGDLLRGVNRNLSWSSDSVGGNVRIDWSRDEGVSWTTLVPTTANDGSETIVVSDRPSRRGRLRIVSLDAPIVSDSSIANLSLR